jgi:hypothetical protein
LVRPVLIKMAVLYIDNHALIINVGV